ncbi:hypothetical protein KTO58_03990 [Chitinophaga pendula]|uniref:DUF7935 family protein n=1 Tax=Chitinophaga TaxID=79328 RepID=UPI000BB0A345|nr:MULTISPECIES: hypothetical protein [Chitinophaga]ASZ14014.1 hypothetical protein CK934_25210 [Chitinophaga sp. MD30]UCJ08358.1 hypothetical protein KTO58_03990 [Chitinophaga pendula]
MPSTQQLLYIVITVGAIALVYMTIKDMLKKPKAAAPVEGGSPLPVVNNAILPLQLQAYERLVLLVDRISPQHLISRTYQSGLSAVDMQILLVQQIKAEFEHNIAQQIYVSPAAWEAVKTLKEQTISIINQVASQLPTDAPALDLNRQILEVFLQSGVAPSDLASQILNAEAKKLM